VVDFKGNKNALFPLQTVFFVVEYTYKMKQSGKEISWLYQNLK